MGQLVVPGEKAVWATNIELYGYFKLHSMLGDIHWWIGDGTWIGGLGTFLTFKLSSCDRVEN
jgi:hypothetical protein